MHKFYENTIESHMISRLVSSISYPIFDTVRRGDFIVEGFRYIYSTYVILCTRTGYLTDYSEQVVVSNHTITSDTLYIGYEYALYEVLSDYYLFDFNLHVDEHKYITSDDYSTDVHIQLGKYLRCYRDLYDINLMPFYNCFALQYADINVRDLEAPLPSNRSTILVPIRLNTDYTIYMDTSAPIAMRTLFYDVKTKQLLKFANGEYITTVLDETLKTTAVISFANPTVYNCYCATEAIYKHRASAYLAIEVPKSFNSSLVVLEGDYVQHNLVLSAENLVLTRPNIIDQAMMTKPALTLINDNISHPYSDKLLEYLSGNVITPQETIYNNVRRIQNASGYSGGTKDVWDLNLRYKLFYDYVAKQSGSVDIAGYGDKQIEYSIQA